MLNQELRNIISKRNYDFEILYTNASGEFRHEIHPSEKTLKEFKKNNHPVKLFNTLPYFYTQKEAVRFCEEENLKLAE